jgi:hypothetical protein
MAFDTSLTGPTAPLEKPHDAPPDASNLLEQWLAVTS